MAPESRSHSRGGGGDSLLSPIGYDDDASSIHSRSEQDSDSDDDELQLRARNSRELRAADRIVLMEEDDIDRLVTDTRRQTQRRGSGLAVPNPFKMLGNGRGRRGSSASGRNISAGSSTEDLVLSEKRRSRRARRQEKKERLMESAQNGEDGELMYEMEEGGMKEGSSTGDSSDRDDTDDMTGLMMSEKATPRRRWRRWVLIHSLIAIGFAILVLVAWKLSKSTRAAKGPFVKPNYVSNGTALFAPTTIILSLDGFRADFLQRGITPRLSSFVKEGVSPKWMHPSFPSVTFPNHYTLATGLYPESHGIVSNTFWDPELKSEFYYTDPDRSLDPKWWGGEPFWVTAERQGVRSAIHMWPGSEAHVLAVEPAFIDKYNGKEILDNKVARIMELLDKPGKEDESAAVDDMRPQLIAAYVPNVDADGHRYGPNSTEIRGTIEKVDEMLDKMFHGLEERNLTDIVNVIVVSDHGMATTDITRLMQLEDLVGDFEIEHIDGWPLYGLRTKSADDIEPLYDHLKAQEEGSAFKVYLRDRDMPERYHFSKNDRIAPVWIVPETGWAIVTKEEFDVAKGQEQNLVYHPRGLHGYDHEHPLMRAIFVARGPAFPHPANSEVPVFQNIEVYNLLCDSLGMEPAPNNGTLRLPLKPIGTHKDEDTPDTPVDPVPNTPTEVPARPTAPEKPAETEKPAVDDSDSSQDDLSNEPPKEDKPQDDDGDKSNDDDDDDKEGGVGGTIKVWWNWVKDKVGEVVDKIKGNSDSSDSGN